MMAYPRPTVREKKIREKKQKKRQGDESNRILLRFFETTAQDEW
jgi:hypothetical protein